MKNLLTYFALLILTACGTKNSSEEIKADETVNQNQWISSLWPPSHFLLNSDQTVKKQS